MENTGNLNEDLRSTVDNLLGNIKSNLEAYKKVDATLSDSTLFNVATHLRMANSALEKGFIKDACDDIENII